MINLLKCTSQNNILPLVVPGDYEEITRIAWEEDGLTSGREFIVEPLDNLYLDPGGAVIYKGGRGQTEVDGVKVEFLFCNVSTMVSKLKLAMESKFKIKRIPIFCYRVLLCTEEFCQKLIDKLEEFGLDDRTLNETLTLDEFMNKAEEEGMIIRADLPRENR